MRWSVFLLACCSWAADSSLPEFVPAGTKIVIGVQVRRILDSPLAAGLNSPQMAMATQMAKGKLGGIDILKDIDEVVIAMTGTGQDGPALAVIKGRFDIKPTETYHGVGVHNDGKTLSALLNSSTLLSGDEASVHDAIDGKGSPLNPALAVKAGDLASRYDIWGVGEDLPPSKEPGVMSTMDHFSFGAALQKGLEITADVHVRSAKDAEKMKSSLGFFEMILAGQKKQKGGPKFDIHTEGGTVSISLSIPEQELKKAMVSTQSSGMLAAMMQRVQPGATASAVRSGPPVIGGSAVESYPSKTSAEIVTGPSGETVRVVLPGGH